MPENVVLYTTLEDRKVAVHLSLRAMRALEKRSQPLHANMELYFSCFVKKIVRFTDEALRTDEVRVSEKLFASFRPVQSGSCNIHELDGHNGPKLIDLPVVKKKAIIPRHLTIDCRNGKWRGDFTSLPKYK